jgi:hypothetical protein
MTEKDFKLSQFWQWHCENSRLVDQPLQDLRDEAMAVLIDSVNLGEITTLDGVDTPLSQRIRAHHGCTDFEMNSHWVGSSQNWACPCCSRSKFEVSRVGKQGQILAKQVVHHDHMGEALEAAFNEEFEKQKTGLAQADGLRLVQRMGVAFAAYEEVLFARTATTLMRKQRSMSMRHVSSRFLRGKYGSSSQRSRTRHTRLMSLG